MDFKKYSELIAHLLVSKQHNELLIKNNESRPPGTAPFPEVNAANFHPMRRERSPDPSRGHGRGRGRDRPENDVKTNFLLEYNIKPMDLEVSDFFAISKEHVNHPDYYTAHGDDATFIAKTYYHTTAALRQLGNGVDALSSVSVSRNMFETIARDILLERMDRTLELYEGSGSNWRLVKSGTPGNFGSFEDILFANNEMQDSPAIVALAPNFDQNGCTVGLGYVDITKRVLGLAEFLDDSHFTNLESALVALGCRECLVPTETGKSSEYRPLYDAISRCGVMGVLDQLSEMGVKFDKEIQGLWLLNTLPESSETL
ncbi:hypothetical protein FXO38_17992 [Capsicum annuum]|nr:hypothetical protein FXO38_17992 [Capsicum annuum]